ncbi:MAG: 2-oxoacid:acceptor oxidoreductase family protein [Candidatus Omnitrophica bacterium]|nr:2-oxoacid:acceptor oxidoreductase family protein [Candidatus Omnitrophota bacterium]MBU1047574.1 2-oxoacid:acceptor oxidoreductase family protein [Candidatus Omnitrophota bacterium]MBU1630326.1 2-oxoacid:acceptor oxidoreductase family protein [Candidatus Omnitrophota bacterium]MBU1766995.1 2-oxoacid:acceptor oxidoreductase family protein [Candidatus Omnitrophota bacterium]MBU1888937.1 2-oxoacid:acceptor oxidoreductase family protein [Candidatus Omnitrophota bacterium]
MKNMVEIRWHGRGGQGAKTAALLFADSAMSAGKFIQAFPEYGPERMGAPVQSFDRLSNEPITLHCGITSPDIVAVLDPTLMATVDVTAGLSDGGVIIINTASSPAEMRKEMGLSGKKIFTIDASGISKETLGRDIPNTPMLGALVKVSGLLEIENVLEDTKKKLEKKFRTKPELIEGNILAIKRAYEEVKGE